MSNSNEHPHHGIDYVELSVTDLNNSKTFYSRAFEWVFTDYGPGYAGIQKPDGGEWGGLNQVDEVQPGGPLVVLYSQNLERTLEQVEAAGGEIAKLPFVFPGGRRFHFRDPSGNVLAVWSEFDEKLSSL